MTVAEWGEKCTPEEGANFFNVGNELEITFESETLGIMTLSIHCEIVFFLGISSDHFIFYK